MNQRYYAVARPTYIQDWRLVMIKATKKKPQDAVVSNVKRLRDEVRDLQKRVRRLEKKK
jgi:hypothetical protein